MNTELNLTNDINDINDIGENNESAVTEVEVTEATVIEAEVIETEVAEPETDDELERNAENPKGSKGPMAKSITSLCFGIVSLICSIPLSIIGIIFGSVAQKLAGAVIADFERSVSANVARAGKITGALGVIISIISLLLGISVLIIIAGVIWLVASAEA